LSSECSGKAIKLEKTLQPPPYSGWMTLLKMTLRTNRSRNINIEQRGLSPAVAKRQSIEFQCQRVDGPNKATSIRRSIDQKNLVKGSLLASPVFFFTSSRHRSDLVAPRSSHSRYRTASDQAPVSYFRNETASRRKEGRVIITNTQPKGVLEEIRSFPASEVSLASCHADAKCTQVLIINLSLHFR
jgi:hypothetical protein